MTPEEVAKAMSVLLDGEPVEPDDNFFDVGGTSLLAIELISVIRDRCGVALPLIDLIGSPTPGGISELVEVYAA